MNKRRARRPMKKKHKEGNRNGVKKRKAKKDMWEVYHMDKQTVVFRNNIESHSKDNKNVKRKDIEKKTNEPNEISYVGNVSHAQYQSDEVHEEEA